MSAISLKLDVDQDGHGTDADGDLILHLDTCASCESRGSFCAWRNRCLGKLKHPANVAHHRRLSARRSGQEVGEAIRVPHAGRGGVTISAVTMSR
jgi:hypothetical protein